MSGELKPGGELTYRDIDAAKFAGRQAMACTAAAELERHTRAMIDSLNLLRAEIGKPPFQLRAAQKPKFRGQR